jgi:hypothetical protein
MKPEDIADPAIDRFYALEDADPRLCTFGIMLVGHVMYRVKIESVSRTGRTVFYRCNDKLGKARRDITGEWQSAEEHRPIRFGREGGEHP